MELFFKLLLGAVAVLALFRFLPGVKQSLKESPKGSSDDWRGVLVPLALVILFVLLLIAMVR